ncbi:MAG: YIP1 family protein [bacterium]
MRSSVSKRMLRLVLQPAEAWTDIAAESGHPAALLLPMPALLAALGPLAFIVGHVVVGGDSGSVPVGRALGWAAVYYALVVVCLFGQAQLLIRLGSALGCRVGPEDALKLSVYASIPFLVGGLVFAVPVKGWESIVIVAGLIGQAYGAFLLYRGLGVLVRAEPRSRGLLAAAAAGGMVTGWILGFFLLAKIVL